MNWVCQEHGMAVNGVDCTGFAIQNVPSFPVRDSDCVVFFVGTIRDDGVFRAWIVDRLLCASNKQFFSGQMRAIRIRVVSNDFDMNSARILKFKGSKLALVAVCLRSDELLRR